MKTLLVILSLLISLSTQAQYKITPNKILFLSLSAINGSVYGMREAYHAQPTVFEDKWGSNPYSFFGSEQWERNYENNRYMSADGVRNAHKHEIFANIGRDFHHTSGYTNLGLTVGTTFIIGGSKQPLKYKAIDMLINSAVFMASSHLTYKHLRQ